MINDDKQFENNSQSHDDTNLKSQELFDKTIPNLRIKIKVNNDMGKNYKK
jgi:hypothetical protein